MIIDIAKCEDCNNCLLACKDEHVENDWPGYTAAQPRHGHRWINVVRKERGQFPLIDVAYRPTPCMHCDNAPCVQASGGAVTKRADGVVLIDPNRAKGQQRLAQACPYGAIYSNEQADQPQKCTLCAHLLDRGWKQPRCVQACPTGALSSVFVEPSEMARVVDSEKLAVLHPEFNTRPRVYYAHLYRFDSCFIAGSVSAENNGTTDCIPNARVLLKRGLELIAETSTDSFGDFKFDGLTPAENPYSVEVTISNLGSREIPVPSLAASVNIGNICFTGTPD